MLKRFAALALATSFALPLAACNAKDAVLTGLYSLQGAAIADGQNGAISASDEGKIVTFTTQAEVAIQVGTKGWQASVKSLWASFVSDLPPADQQKYAIYIATISAAVQRL